MFLKKQEQLDRRSLALKERKRLSFQLGLPFGVFVLAVVTLLLAATYFVQDRANASTKIIPQAHVDSLAFRVEQAVEHSTAVASMIARLSGGTIDVKNLEVVRTLIDSDPAILSVSFINDKMEAVWDIRSMAAPSHERMPMSQLPRAVHFDKAVPGPGGVMLQSIHFPVYGESGAQIGVLEVVYDISVFWEILADYTDGDAYIVDGEGEVLLMRRTNGESTSTISAIEGVRNFVEHKRVVSEYTEEDGTGMLSAWSAVRLPNWAVVVEEPAAVLFGQLRAMYAFIGFLSFIVAFLFINEAIIIKRKIFIPLSMLSESAQRIALGEQNTWVGTNADNEFDTVGEAINIMARNVRTLRQGLEERIAERTMHLEAKTQEAERLNTFMVNRELRMLELKEKNKKLEEELAMLKEKPPEPSMKLDQSK